MLYKSVLQISDQHYHYSHPDIYAFLKALKQKFKPDLVLNGGDEVDQAAMSFHEKDPDLFSPGDELQRSISRMKPLFTLFPKMKLLESNHGSLIYRRGKWAGLPKHVFKSYRDVLGAPRGWTWHPDLIYKMSNSQEIYSCHSRGSDVLKISKQMGMSVSQFHSHSLFEIRYWQSPSTLHFAMTSGCLIDAESRAFDYGRLSLQRPVIGTSVIINGHPLLQPMIMKNGRWTGKLV